MRKADRLAWTIARHAGRIGGGTLFAASGSAAAGIRLAQEMFGSTLHLWGHGGAYGPRGMLAMHARHWLFNKRQRAHVTLPQVFDTLSEPHALMATPAQVDGSANANLSAIGAHSAPKVAFGGARGLPDARTVHFVLPTHNPRQLVQRVDFVSTAASSRDDAPMLFTELCVMIWNKAAGNWRLSAIAPDSSVAAIRDRTGFSFDATEQPEVLTDPSPQALDLLAAIDPLGIRDLDFVAGRAAQLDALERIYAAEARLVGERHLPAHRRSP